jgi:hypothetical protein
VDLPTSIAQQQPGSERKNERTNEQTNKQTNKRTNDGAIHWFAVLSESTPALWRRLNAPNAPLQSLGLRLAQPKSLSVPPYTYVHSLYGRHLRPKNSFFQAG